MERISKHRLSLVTSNQWPGQATATTGFLPPRADTKGTLPLNRYAIAYRVCSYRF
jgi:hypothetical protein